MVETKSIERNSMECNSIETIDTPNLNNQQFKLNKIGEIEEYFIAEIKGIYISFFDYFDKSLIVLSVTSGGVSIASSATAIGAPIGITSASFSLAFSLCTGLVKKLLKKQEIKKEA